MYVHLTCAVSADAGGRCQIPLKMKSKIVVSLHACPGAQVVNLGPL